MRAFELEKTVVRQVSRARRSSAMLGLRSERAEPPKRLVDQRQHLGAQSLERTAGPLAVDAAELDEKAQVTWPYGADFCDKFLRAGLYIPDRDVGDDLLRGQLALEGLRYEPSTFQLFTPLAKGHDEPRVVKGPLGRVERVLLSVPGMALI